MTGAERIAQERARQIEAHGFDASHDDRHKAGELAWAAVCYAAPGQVRRIRRDERRESYVDPWPWPDGGDMRLVWAPTGRERIRLLEKAGAFIAAEIDRLLRAEAQP